MEATIKIEDIADPEWWEIKEELEALLKDWDLKYNIKYYEKKDGGQENPVIIV